MIDELTRLATDTSRAASYSMLTAWSYYSHVFGKCHRCCEWIWLHGPDSWHDMWPSRCNFM